MNEHTTVTGFRVRHSGKIVEVTKTNVPPEQFGDEVNRAHDILRHFRMSSAGSIWGCDGIGYDIQKRAGVVHVKKSGVGPRKFKEGLATVDWQS